VYDVPIIGMRLVVRDRPPSRFRSDRDQPGKDVAHGSTAIPGSKGSGMRLYIFKSETTRDLRAFAGDPAGSKLPSNHGPWTVTGVVGVDRAPPHNFSRDAIEAAISGAGFQLWRMVKKAGADA
jgi:hypothetical protein